MFFMSIWRSWRLQARCTIPLFFLAFFFIFKVKICFEISKLVSPEFDLSKKVILVKAPPKETCPRKSCEIQGGAKFDNHGKWEDLFLNEFFFFSRKSNKTIYKLMVVKFSPPKFPRTFLDRSSLAAPLPERVCWTGQIPGGGLNLTTTVR